MNGEFVYSPKEPAKFSGMTLGDRTVRTRRRPLLAASAALVYLACWEAVHHFFWRHQLIGDMAIYHRYATLMRHGAVPYRDFAFEYPPGALPVVLVPVYFDGYVHAFALLMAVLGAGLVVTLSFVAPVRRVVFVAVSPLLAGGLVFNRFDLWPVLLATIGMLLLVRDRHRLGWAILGAGVAVKLWPLVLLPLAAAWTLKRRGRRELFASASACAAVIAAVFVPFVVLAPHGLWQSIWGQVSRPMEIESLGASLLMVVHRSGIATTYTSLDASGVLVRPVTDFFEAVEAMALVALWVAFARGRAEDGRFARYAAACVCAFVALGKVLSPQYLLWLVPLVAIVPARRGLHAIALLACAFVLTQVIYPTRYIAYAYHYHLAWVVLLRNLLLLALLARLSVSEAGIVRLEVAPLAAPDVSGSE